MARLILLPFVVHPQVAGITESVVPVGAISVAAVNTLATADDVVRLYRQYLRRDPENSGAIAGRVGRPLVDVELEIATSDEAIATLFGGAPVPATPGVPIPAAEISPWGKRVGLLIAQDMASELRLPVAPYASWVPLAVQADIEDARGTSYGARTNNPLNLRPRVGSPWPGQTGVSPGGFAEFATIEAGALACAQNYTTADSGGFYTGVNSAFRSGDPIALAQAIDDSPWNAGGYGGRIVAGTRSAIGQ